jgi:hypothetical protein
VRLFPSGRTLQDDIILDQTDPKLTSAKATRAGKQYTLRVKATDRASGLATLQIVSKKAKKSLEYAAKTRVKLPAGKVSVRVRDHAGNWSRSKRIK